MTDGFEESKAYVAPLASRLFKGTLWMFLMRWTMRLMTILSVMILARLLDPADFGLMAMAAAVVAFPMVILEFGLDKAIIREAHPTNGLYNTAWTVKVLKLTVIAGFIWGFGSSIAAFFDEPRVEKILPFLALSVFISSFESMWVVSYRKNMNYRADFIYNFSCKLLATAITIALAFHLQSFWALVYGQVAASGVRVLLSVIGPMKVPRFTFSEWPKIWHFARWSMFRGIAIYIVEHGDRIILGRFGAADTVGTYTIGREIAEMPMSEISAPANRALGPGFSALQDEPERLAKAVSRSMGAIASITFPFGVGFFLIADQAIPLMLGAGWDDAVPVLKVLSFAAVVTTFAGVCNNTLIILGYVKDAAILLWIRALIMLALAVPGAITFGSVGVSAALLLANLVSMCNSLFMATRKIEQLTMSHLWENMYRPLVSSIFMAAPLMWFSFEGLSEPIILLVKIGLGSVLYVSSLILLWLCSGRPDGLEKSVFEILKTRISRRSR